MATLRKLSDDVFGGNHPNNINAGYEKITEHIPTKPIVDQCYYFGSLRTSIVTEVIYDNDHECKFKTMNSTYLIIK